MEKTNDNKIMDDNIRKLLIRLADVFAKLNKFRVERFAEIEQAREWLLDKTKVIQSSGFTKELAILKVILEEIMNKPQLFMQRKADHTSKLNELGEEELAKEIEKINIPNPETINELKAVLRLVLGFKRFNREGKDDETRLRVIREATTQLREKTGKFEQKGDEESGKITELLKKTEAGMTAEELQYLLVYLIDLDALHTLASRGDLAIEWFIRRVKEYRQGDGSEATVRKVPIKGLVSKFEDTKIRKMLDKNDAVRNLLTYEEQKVFIKELLELLQSTIHNRDWEGEFTKPDGTKVKMPFRGTKGFYNNLDKGHNIIEMIRAHYGNHAFADKLEAVKKKAGEQPLLFEKELARLHMELHEPASQAKVIIAAVQSLEKIFRERLAQLEGEQQRELNKRVHELAKMIRSMGDVTETINRLEKIYQKRVIKFDNKWKEKADEYLEEELRVTQSIENIFSDIETIMLGLNLKEAAEIFTLGIDMQMKSSSVIHSTVKSLPQTITFENIPQTYQKVIPAVFFQAKLDDAIATNAELYEELNNNAASLSDKLNDLLSKTTAMDAECVRLRMKRMSIMEELKVHIPAASLSKEDKEVLSNVRG